MFVTSTYIVFLLTGFRDANLSLQGERVGFMQRDSEFVLVRGAFQQRRATFSESVAVSTQTEASRILRSNRYHATTVP